MEFKWLHFPTNPAGLSDHFNAAHKPASDTDPDPEPFDFNIADDEAMIKMAKTKTCTDCVGFGGVEKDGDQIRAIRRSGGWK